MEWWTDLPYLVSTVCLLPTLVGSGLVLTPVGGAPATLRGQGSLTWQNWVQCECVCVWVCVGGECKYKMWLVLLVKGGTSALTEHAHVNGQSASSTYIHRGISLHTNQIRNLLPHPSLPLLVPGLSSHFTIVQPAFNIKFWEMATRFHKCQEPPWCINGIQSPKSQLAHVLHMMFWNILSLSAVCRNHVPIQQE